MADRGTTILDPLAAAIAAASCEEARLSRLPLVGQVTLRAGRDAVSLAGVALDLALPTEPNRVASDGGRAAVWLGPDEWLILLPRGDVASTVARLEMALDGGHFAAVDTSAARLGLALSGPAARQVLAKGCGLDLHPRAFAPGDCAQTALARVPVLLVQRDEAPTFWVFVRPSYAVFLARWLIDAIAELRLAPIPGLDT
ncbi:MAG: sarcosine oxidase subunit gamma [Alphaproteobacteria bacterium]|nr:sarcosine oxidase subunit gamma [Alphaproteobacteria bacterium]